MLGLAALIGWTAQVRLHVLMGHTKMVHVLRVLADGRLLSASRDCTLRVPPIRCCMQLLPCRALQVFAQCDAH